jgi:hypothetical protein
MIAEVVCARRAVLSRTLPGSKEPSKEGTLFFGTWLRSVVFHISPRLLAESRTCDRFRPDYLCHVFVLQFVFVGGVASAQRTMPAACRVRHVQYAAGPA